MSTVNVCDGSEAEAVGPTTESDRECQCAAGHYVYVNVNTATESCQPCPSGTYQPSANADNVYSKAAVGESCEVSGSEGTTTCVSGYCDPSTNTCSFMLCDTCHLCITEAECNAADHDTFCAWGYYNERPLVVGCAPGDIPIVQTLEHILYTVNGESIAKKAMAVNCEKTENVWNQAVHVGHMGYAVNLRTIFRLQYNIRCL